MSRTSACSAGNPGRSVRRVRSRCGVCTKVGGCPSSRLPLRAAGSWSPFARTATATGPSGPTRSSPARGGGPRRRSHPRSRSSTDRPSVGGHRCGSGGRRRPCRVARSHREGRAGRAQPGDRPVPRGGRSDRHRSHAGQPGDAAARCRCCSRIFPIREVADYRLRSGANKGSKTRLWTLNFGWRATCPRWIGGIYLYQLGCPS